MKHMASKFPRKKCDIQSVTAVIMFLWSWQEGPWEVSTGWLALLPKIPASSVCPLAKKVLTDNLKNVLNTTRYESSSVLPFPKTYTRINFLCSKMNTLKVFS